MDSSAGDVATAVSTDTLTAPAGAASPGAAPPAAGEPERPSGPETPTNVAPLAAAILRTGAARPMESSAPVATSVVPPAVHDQIVSAVVPLHGRGDGRHEVTLELRPDELGAIRVEVSVEHQTVHLTLHAADPATGRLLSAALPELRSALTDAGLTAGHVGVGPGGGGGTGGRRPTGDDTETNRRGRTGRRHDDTTAASAARTTRPAPAGRLDLLL